MKTTQKSTLLLSRHDKHFSKLFDNAPAGANIHAVIVIRINAFGSDFEYVYSSFDLSDYAHAYGRALNDWNDEISRFSMQGSISLEKKSFKLCMFEISDSFMLDSELPDGFGSGYYLESRLLKIANLNFGV